MIDDLRVKIFADGADVAGIASVADDPMIKGFTTNPTLMRQAGVDNYEQFAYKAIEVVDGKPISFEVFSDDFTEMHRQALRLAAFGDNVYVKIPVTNTTGASSAELIGQLSSEGVRVNVTAVFTRAQIETVAEALSAAPSGYLSVFAGRIADAGQDPIPLVQYAIEAVRAHPAIEVIWASPREVLNIVQADRCGCHVITVTNELLKKLTSLGKDLATFSLETVQMFRRDAEAAGYEL
jgi:transaldolase